jgi:putative endopeptidase
VIPPDRANYGTIIMLREGAQEAVRGILEGQAATPAASESIGQKVGDFYKSFTAAAQVESLGIQPLSAELAAIGGISSARDLPAAFARTARLGVGVPLSVVVGRDPQHSDVYAVLVSQSGLGMPDRDYYLPGSAASGLRRAWRRFFPAGARRQTATGPWPARHGVRDRWGGWTRRQRQTVRYQL